MRTLLFRLVVVVAVISGCGSGTDKTAASSTSVNASAVESSPLSDQEREARAIDALVAAGRIGEAHTRARIFVQSHPDGPYAAHVTALMGVHPHREGPQPGADRGVTP